MVKLAVIGTGGMAHHQVESFGKIENCAVVAACDIDEKRVLDFAKKFAIPAVYTDVDRLLAEVECDAVSIVTPDAYHHPLALKAIAAGKHVLCEKPLALNAEDAWEMSKAAVAAGVINMVNFSYRNSSAIQMAAKLARRGELGTIRHVHAYYLQSWLAQDEWNFWETSPQWLWRLSTKAGSMGVLGDIGVHILDFAGLPVGGFESVHCKLKTFDKGDGNTMGGYELDANDSAIITAEFANGALGTIHTTRWAQPHINSLRLNVYGDKASIEIDLDESYSSLKISRILGRKAMDWETLDCGVTPTNFERFVAAVETGVQDQPDFARGAEIQSVLDACFESDRNDKTVVLPKNDTRKENVTK
ncbi:Gfo/Idh/MocA family oxidoreductase [Pelagicoccus sp. SDUM812005]|uniref:Gfo/Idh/MocA family protein n=1 Tax=Pelagicoccus sp. SDUM812005 TaxID=3041257 RepID=UPI00280F17D6|nr:Gfo/Idh/MocA family oxidoreductase [Pelagicoccus sp. SDUM812005]MDQ8180047.1 Gfo/Idh/MocA family oxidoreductase [Pelagicoccus sp. SDUM812005]